MHSVNVRGRTSEVRGQIVIDDLDTGRSRSRGETPGEKRVTDKVKDASPWTVLTARIALSSLIDIISNSA